MSRNILFGKILFEQRGDFVINGVCFHKEILKYNDYFDSLLKFNPYTSRIVLRNGCNDIFSEESMKILKMYMYGQLIKWCEFNVDLIIECANLAKMLCLQLVPYSAIFDENINTEMENLKVHRRKDVDTLILCSTYSGKHCVRSQRIHNIALHLFLEQTEEYLPKMIELFKLNYDEYKHEDSMFCLAICYKIGICCEISQSKFQNLLEENKNHELSIKFLNSEYKIADMPLKPQHNGNNIGNILHYVHHVYRLGFIGNGKKIIDQDYVKMIELCELSAFNYKNKKSLHDLAMYYEYGIGLTMDKSIAAQLYEKNWNENQYHPSLYNLGILLTQNNTEEDNKIAFQHFAKCADGHYGFAFAALGNCYELGIGVEKNIKEAFRNFEKGWIEYDDKACLYSLAELYRLGKGVEINLEKSREYHRQCLFEFHIIESIQALLLL